MKQAALKPGSMPRDIEFPEGVERSCKGALYLSSTHKPVTDAELAYIKQALPSVYEQLWVLDPEGEQAVTKAAFAAKEAAAAPEGVDAPADVAETASFSTVKRKK